MGIVLRLHDGHGVAHIVFAIWAVILFFVVTSNQYVYFFQHSTVYVVCVHCVILSANVQSNGLGQQWLLQQL